MMYCWQVLEAGEWNIIGAELPGMGVSPLVTTRAHAAELFGPFAEAHHATTGLPVRLVRYEDYEIMRSL